MPGKRHCGRTPVATPGCRCLEAWGPPGEPCCQPGPHSTAGVCRIRLCPVSAGRTTSLALSYTLLALGRSGSRSTVFAAETTSAGWRGQSCLSQRKCDSDRQISRLAYLQHQEILCLLFSRSKKASGKPKIRCAPGSPAVPGGAQPVCQRGWGLPPTRGSCACPDPGTRLGAGE